MKPAAATRLPPRVPRPATLLALAGACAVFAAWIAASGGFDAELAGLPVRARSWERPALLAALFGAVAVARLRGRITAWAMTIIRPGRAVHALLLVPILGAAAVGLVFGTYAAGGSDSYGYLSQARLLAAGRLVDAHPTHRAFTWPEVATTLAPLGYRPGRAEGTIVPTYPPGLPLLMAPLAAVHPQAMFLLVPLAAALTVWLCGRLGTLLREPLAGALGACLLAASPTFLYHAVQPMSDVPVAACWTAALVLSRRRDRWGSVGAGLASGLAVLIRPNLAPLALFVIAAAAVGHGPRGRTRAIECALAAVPGAMTLAVINAVRYGSPFASGYGTLDELFSMANVVPNLGRYSGWLTAMHTPFIWLWLFTPLWVRGAPMAVRLVGWVCWGFSLALYASYLPYAVFNPDEWFYTRFLLPALPAMLVLSVAVTLGAARRTIRHAEPATVLLVALLVVVGLVRAASGHVFDLAAAERRYPAVGAFVRDRLPEDAFILADQHSGSIRYYAGRPTLRWQLLDRASLDDAVEGLGRAGYTPYVVLDAFEEPIFRERFASSALVDRLVLVATIEQTRVHALR